MNTSCSKKSAGGAAARFTRESLATLAVFAASGPLYAQEKAQDRRPEISFRSIPSPETLEAITPTAASAFLLGHGVGTQGYICLPTSTGTSWTVSNARPGGTLFTNIFGEPVQRTHRRQVVNQDHFHPTLEHQGWICSRQSRYRLLKLRSPSSGTLLHLTAENA